MIVNQVMLDYVTVTTWHKEVYLKLCDFPLPGEGLKCRSVSFNGYNGISSSTSKGSFINADGEQLHPVDKREYPHYVVKVSGEMADEFWEVVDSVKYWCEGRPVEMVVKRVDVQATIPIPSGYKAIDLYLKMQEWIASGDCKIRTLKLCDNYGSQEGKDTIYGGSRTSNRFWRLYVKEDKDGNLYLRWELQLGGEQAETFRYSLAKVDLLRCFRCIPHKARRTKKYAWVNDFVALCQDEGGEKRAVLSKERDTVLWLYKAVKPAIINAVNMHQTREEVLTWLDELIAELPDVGES